MSRAAEAPEFSRPVTLASLQQGSRQLVIEATAAECDALARRFGLEGVRSLSARLELVPKPSGAVSLRGTMRAVVDRACVVTLEPMTERIEAPLSVLFRPEGAAAREVTLDVELEEDEEPLSGGVIDAGEVVAQTMALALDPWPKRPGARLGEEEAS